MHLWGTWQEQTSEPVSGGGGQFLLKAIVLPLTCIMRAAPVLSLNKHCQLAQLAQEPRQNIWIMMSERLWDGAAGWLWSSSSDCLRGNTNSVLGQLMVKMSSWTQTPSVCRGEADVHSNVLQSHWKLPLMGSGTEALQPHAGLSAQIVLFLFCYLKITQLKINKLFHLLLFSEDHKMWVSEGDSGD